MIGLRRLGPELDGELRLDPQQIAPLHRPVVGELLPLQQTVDQRATLVGVAIRQKLPRLVGRGQRADHVEIDPAHKHGVGAQVRRSNAQPLQAGENQLVDLALGSQDRRALSKVLDGRWLRPGTGQRGRQGDQGRQIRHHLRSPPQDTRDPVRCIACTPPILGIQPHAHPIVPHPAYTREPAPRLHRSSVFPPFEETPSVLKRL